MSNALVPVKEFWKVIQEELAPAAVASRMYGVTVPQAALMMLTAVELGLPVTATFDFFDLISGKPAIKPKGALALIQRSVEFGGLKISDHADSKGNPTSCTVWMRRLNGFEYTTTFSMEDAERAALVKPDSGWAKYPANMLRWRAVGYCADIVFPDVIGGLYRPEELGATVDEDGAPMDSEWTVNDNPTVTVIEHAPQPAEKPTAPSLHDLIATYGAEAIMTANEGRIPATEDDLRQVAFALGG